jgi:hypothetical protein
MCYSAKVWQRIKEYMRYRGVALRYGQYELLFQRRLTNPGQRIPRGFEDNFAHPENEQERRRKALIDEHRGKLATQWEQDLFKQKKRLADAQRSLQAKETKAARESERIATNKVQALTERLADLKRTDPKPDDAHIPDVVGADHHP